MTSETKRILLADDDDDFRLLVSIWLRNAGFDVVEATNGAEAVRIARDHRFHLLLLDIVMPELDGFAALEQIRATGAKVPAMFVSSHSSLREKVQAKAATTFLAKPLSPRELVTAVNSVLDE